MAYIQNTAANMAAAAYFSSKGASYSTAPQLAFSTPGFTPGIGFSLASADVAASTGLWSAAAAQQPRLG